MKTYKCKVCGEVFQVEFYFLEPSSAYILPIKKMEGESALNNFVEFTMLSSSPVTEFFGFTEPEVRDLCDQHQMDFESIQKWYDGYLIDGVHIYNPNSVSRAMTLHKLDSYWKNTASFESINRLIQLNLDGLKDDILTMLGGGRVCVNVKTFTSGTRIKSAIKREFSNGLEPKVIRVEPGDNQGVTDLVLREYFQS